MTILQDQFDVMLLNMLQANARATADELAASVPLSPSAIARRLRRLRKSGAIAGDFALVGSDITRQWLIAVVHVQLDRHKPELTYGPFRDRLLAAAEVQGYMEISGVFDLLLLVATRHLEDFNRFADGYLASDPAVRRYETAIVKRRLKLAPIFPLSNADLSS